MTRRATSRPKSQTPLRIAPAVYPFTAIVGQEEMKLALLLNVIDPLIGGVLIMGHRGTGKSTAVRAIADLLPQVWRAGNCHYGCDPDDAENLCNECYEELRAKGKLTRRRSHVPVVNLPLGATEDRVCGTIDIERALKEGVKAFEPGLLARANRGFLYVDEVNLLEDHLVDLLLDVAVTGRNSVEREGISLEHPARFVLVGSGNPEEGELRPQLVDRFGLCTEIQTLEDLDQRVEIVELREAFERDPHAFHAAVDNEQLSLRRRLGRARKLASQVTISKELLREVAGLCLNLKVDGHRGELTIVRAARALAAFEGRRKVIVDDIRRITPLALRHRLRRDPLDPTSGGGSRIEKALDDTFPQTESDTGRDDRSALQGSAGGSKTTESNTAGDQKGDDGRSLRDDAKARLAPQPQAAHLPDQALKRDSHFPPKRRTEEQSVRSQKSGNSFSYNARRGRYSRAVLHGSYESRVALDATLRSTAVNACRDHLTQHIGTARQATPYTLRPTLFFSDVRFKAFKRKQGTLFIMAIDTSGSMALNRIERAKGALVWLLNKSYIKRDRVALVSFRGKKAEELLQPSQSMSRARRVLDELLIGGSTPLASALLCSLNIARRVRRQGTERIELLVFTDGRANVSLRASDATKTAFKKTAIRSELEQLGAALQQLGVSTVIVDTQSRFTSGGEGRVLAELLGARNVYLSTSLTVDEQFAAQLC